jgi:hypothetical protein
MKKVKVLLDFIRFAIAMKIAFYRNVITKLTDNVFFTKPDVSLADAKTSVDKLETAFIGAQDGGHTAVAAMHDAEAEADAIFRILAAYVDRIADGDETKILSSGFHPSAQPTTIQKPALSAEDGDNSGSVRLVAKAIEKAGSYIWQIGKDVLPTDESGWSIIGQSTRAYYDLTGLTVGAKYYFRVAAVTPDGTTDFTAAVLKIVI